MSLLAPSQVHSRKTTTVFTSGNSQAVRLPKEFRLHTKTVSIERRGDEIVLRELPQSLGTKLQSLFAALPALNAHDLVALEQLRVAAKDARPPQARDVAVLLAPGTTPTRVGKP